MATQQPQHERVINVATLPIFISFFTWGFGTGAQHLGRALFAYSLTQNMFLVGVLIASNAIPRFFTGPITGYLTDRLGRKPLVIMGCVIRGLTNLAQFFAPDYITFLVLELIGQVGVAMWNTGANVLLSDVTSPTNRGRVLALRHMSTRIGFVAGPLLGGVIATAFGLRSVFLINAASKLVIVAVVWFMVSETKPDAEKKPTAPAAPGARPRSRLSLAPFKDRSFLALAAATIGLSFTQAGILQSLLPVHAQVQLGASAAQVGFLLTLAPIFAFAFAYPNGMMADRFGRKASLIPGLLLLAVAAFILDLGALYVLLIIAMVFQGTGEAMAFGTTQTYAMDLAPERGRGTFLGMWSVSQSTGAILGPLVLTGLYEFVSPTAAFTFLGGFLILAALLLGLMGRETAGPRAKAPPPLP